VTVGRTGRNLSVWEFRQREGIQRNVPDLSFPAGGMAEAAGNGEGKIGFFDG